MALVPLTGSARPPHKNAKATAHVSPDERLEVTVVLRHNAADDAAAKRAAARESATKGEFISREEFAATHAASAGDIKLVSEFAQEHGLAVAHASAPRRMVILSGTVDRMEKAFGVTLNHYAYADGTYRGHEGPVQIPEALKGIVTAVLGLDNRPQARTLLRPMGVLPTYYPPQVAKLYNFPTCASGKGQCIALIELGGGFRPGDLATYFQSLGLQNPNVVAVSVDGGQNAPTGDPNGPDGEVMLDIEVAASVAEGADIAVYFAPNTDSGFLDAITKAIHDAHLKPSVISISWGGPETGWAPNTLDAYDSALQDAAVLGVTVCVASGDRGSSDGVPGGTPVVDFPASSPHVLACGGTRLVSLGSIIKLETVWNDGPDSATGGGVSTHFGLPSYQIGAGVPFSPAGKQGRGVPDVAGNADPRTGYRVRVDGVDFVIGGTSAVAPLWAALVALFNNLKGGSVGFLNPSIYRPPCNATFHDITVGNNGAYNAGPGWDPCTGLGSPNGTALANCLGICCK